MKLVRPKSWDHFFGFSEPFLVKIKMQTLLKKAFLLRKKKCRTTVFSAEFVKVRTFFVGIVIIIFIAAIIAGFASICLDVQYFCIVWWERLCVFVSFYLLLLSLSSSPTLLLPASDTDILYFSYFFLSFYSLFFFFIFFGLYIFGVYTFLRASGAFDGYMFNVHEILILKCKGCIVYTHSKWLSGVYFSQRKNPITYK